MTLNQAEIIALLDSYDKQSRALRKEALKISWFMRGGASYADVMAFSPDDRNAAAEMINEHMEITKTTKLPFF